VPETKTRLILESRFPVLYRLGIPINGHQPPGTSQAIEYEAAMTTATEGSININTIHINHEGINGFIE
jgi:hypothetical protein